MKTLVVYYSLSGNTKRIGNAIAKALKADKEEIQDLGKRKPYNTFLECIFGMKAKIKKTKDVSKYDLVVIGTPVWCGSMSGPVRTYLSQNKFKNAAFFCTMGGSGDQRTFNKMQKMSKKPKATLSVRVIEIKENNFSSKVKEFVKKVKC